MTDMLAHKGSETQIRSLKPRKKLEVPLKEIEKCYIEAAKRVRLGYWERDFVNDTAFWANETYEIFGVDADNFEPTYENLLNLVHPSDRESFQASVRKTLESRNMQDIMYRIVRPDGDERYIHSISNCICDKNGKAIRLAGTIHDITEQKKTEQSYQMLFREMLDGFALHEIICDDNGNPIDYRFLAVNPAFERLTGLSGESLIGKTVMEALPKTEPYWIEKYGRAVLTGKQETFENYSRELGRYFQVTAFRYAKNQFACIFMDITERKLTEMSLRESETRFKDITKSMADWVWEVDQNGKYTYVSDTVKNILGYSSEELIGKTPFDLMPEEERVKIGEIFSEIAARSGPIVDLENWNIAKDGTKVCLLTNGVPIIDADGKLHGYRGVDKDITHQKKIEAEKAAVEAQLQQAQKLEAIGTLAGGIAHDFNNILYPIIGFTEMMLDHAPDGSELKQNLNEVLTASLRASDLVRQILAFSRQTGRELSPLKIQMIIKEIIKLMRSFLPSTITIRQQIDNDCGIVLTDPTHIHQIAMNLITNAYHAMEADGGTLTIGLSEVTITADDLKNFDLNPGKFICFSVSDTGHGIEKHLLNRIFEPYFTTKKEGKGTGLGLSVTHGIVKTYKGDIRVYSEPGKGSVFNVYLPVIDSKREEDRTDTDLFPVPGGDEHILLVDDEEPILKMEKQMLKRLGYRITSRTDSREALEAFRSSPSAFDLVITDMTMPHMTGEKLASELKHIREKIPIILCTGFSEKISGEKAEALGIDGFLMKPIVKNDLAQKIRAVLDAKKRG